MVLDAQRAARPLCRPMAILEHGHERTSPAFLPMFLAWACRYRKRDGNARRERE
jgi:hypothetical protein